MFGDRVGSDRGIVSSGRASEVGTCRVSPDFDQTAIRHTFYQLKRDLAMNRSMSPLHPDETPTRVRVVKPCWLRGEPQEVGTEHDLPAFEASGALSTGRVELVPWKISAANGAAY